MSYDFASITFPSHRGEMAIGALSRTRIQKKILGRFISEIVKNYYLCLTDPLFRDAARYSSKTHVLLVSSISNKYPDDRSITSSENNSLRLPNMLLRKFMEPLMPRSSKRIYEKVTS